MWNFTGKQRPEFAIEPGDGEESVWDYPRPPICVRDSREVVVSLENLAIGKTRRALRVLETASPPTFYIPMSDVVMDLFEQTAGSSFCEWKGAATYWSLNSGNKTIPNVGWSYQSPSNPFAEIKNCISFYPAKLTCTVNGEVVQPQPGGFYGGWVTSEIVGPYKGEPGNQGW